MIFQISGRIWKELFFLVASVKSVEKKDLSEKLGKSCFKNSTLISLITVEVGINVEGVQKLQNQ